MEFYNASLILFGDLQKYTYTIKNLSDLTSEFKKNSIDLLPNPIEIAIFSEKGSSTESRLGFKGEDGPLEVIFLPDSIMITTNLFFESNDLVYSDIESFINHASNILNIALNAETLITFRGSRLSFIADISLASEYSNEAEKKFNIGTGNDNPKLNLIEWKQNTVHRTYIDLIDEEINILKSVGRQEGQLLRNNEVVDKNSIHIHYDLNTLQQNANPRIDKKFISGFTSSIKQYIDLEKVRGEVYGTK